MFELELNLAPVSMAEVRPMWATMVENIHIHLKNEAATRVQLNMTMKEQEKEIETFSEETSKNHFFVLIKVHLKRYLLNKFHNIFSLLLGEQMKSLHALECLTFLLCGRCTDRAAKSFSVSLS